MDMSQPNSGYMTTGRQGGCEQEQVCPPEPPACARPDDIDCGCACAAGMAAALELLCDARLAELVDFSKFAFVTGGFVLGSPLNCPDNSTAPYDNFTGPLAGVFERITPCTCENLEVSGQIYYPIPVCSSETCCAGGPAFDAGEVALCALKAVAFGVAEGKTCGETEENYQQLKRLLWQALHCSACTPAAVPAKATPCDGTPGSISRRRTLSVTAGPLLVANAAVLGTVGNVVVLANDTDRRFYFICDDSVDFIG